MSAESRPPAPPSRRNWVFLALAVALAGGGYFALKSGDKATGPRYRTTTLEKRTVIRRVEASGHLAVIRRVEVPSLLQGRMLKVNKKLKDEVKAGEVLASLEPLPTSMNADVATAQVAAASGGVAQAEVEVRALRAQLKQAESLKAKGLAGEAEVQSVRVKVEAAEAAMRAAGAQRTAAKAALSSGNGWPRTPTSSRPSTASCSTRRTSRAAWSAPAAAPSSCWPTRSTACTSPPRSPSWTSRSCRTARPPRSPSIPSPARNSRPRSCRWGSRRPAPGSLVTYPVTFELENPGRRLRPGLSATAGVEADRAADTFAVPEAALRYAPADAPPAEDRSRVFRVTQAGTLETVAIRAGLSDGAFTVVMSAEKAPPLALGDAIVIGTLKADEAAPAGGINLTGKKP